jgi:hypothetical protein
MSILTIKCKVPELRKQRSNLNSQLEVDLYFSNFYSVTILINEQVAM